MTDVRYASSDVARAAYEHFVWHMSESSTRPKWEALSPKEQDSWRAAAQAAIESRTQRR